MGEPSDELVIGIDASTTAVKALVVDGSGHVLSEGRAPISLVNPEPDAWEQDAEEWWSSLLEAVEQALSGLPAPSRSRVRAIAIACQRETFVACDDEGSPLAKAIVWMDARARREAEEVGRTCDRDRIHRLSGKPVCVTPSLYKIRFLLTRARPDLRERPLTIVDVHGFLAWRLTGLRVTSLASADPLGLVDIEAGAWSDELARLAQISLSELPALVPPGQTMGPLRAALAERFGLGPGVVVVAGAGDGQAAGLGAGVTAREAEGAPQTAYMNLGTALVAGVVSRTYRIDRAFRTLFGCSPKTFFLETDLKGGTFTLDWLADRILATDGSPAGRTAKLAELEEKARHLPPGASGLITVPYLLGVMNPIWNDDASGILLGLRGDHGPEHLYRSIVEGLAFEARHHLEGVERAAGAIDEIVVMGGASRSDLVLSIFADVLGKPIVRSLSSEATGLGAAMLAFSALGRHETIEAASRAMSARGSVTLPGASTEVYDRLYREVYSGLFDAVSSRMTRLSELTRS